MGEKIYKKEAELKEIEILLSEADQGINNKNRTIKDSSIPEVLGAAVGVGAGGAIGLGLLSTLGVAGLSAAGITSGLATAGAIVGGGMVAGIGVLAAPAVLLGVGGYALLSNINKNKLEEKKDALLKEAIKKHQIIIQNLSNKADLSEERIQYLTGLNVSLQRVINNLQNDLSKV